MKKIPGFTTTADLPADVQELYELTAALEGGPVFDLPAVRQYDIDFSKLTVHQAEVLVQRKWKGIRRKVKTNEFVEEAPPPEPHETPSIPEETQSAAAPVAAVAPRRRGSEAQ